MDENTHWILIYINVKTKSFFPINPYHPLNPNKNDVEVGMKIAASFSVCLKLEKLTCVFLAFFEKNLIKQQRKNAQILY